jgi:energy-coupling factor transport system permease protein
MLRFHSLTWLIWLVAGVVAVTSNPLLNLLVMAQAMLVALACHTDSPVGRSFRLFVWLGLLLVAIRTLLSAVPVGGYSYGATPLFTIPEFQLPIWLGGIQLGGVATLEMIVGGLANGLRLWALILVFGAFNAVADQYGLLRRTPRVLFHAGLVVTVALTFVPHLIIQLEAIRDAQRVRGHRFRSWRDGLPLLVPLLAGGLERSLQLAAAMDSRGYGRTTVSRHGASWSQLLIILGLTMLGIGLYVGFTGDGRGFLAGALGLLIAIGALRQLSSGAPRSRYLRERWYDRDTLVMLASLFVIGGISLLRFTDDGGLVWTALPRLTLPPFEPLAGVLVTLLGTPALISLFNLESRNAVEHSLCHARPRLGKNSDGYHT